MTDDDSALLLRMGAEGPGETGGPAPDRLISGNPVFTTWSVQTIPQCFQQKQEPLNLIQLKES